MPLIKILNFDRTIKKLAIGKSLEELKIVAKRKLNYDENIPVKILFQSDGTEIDTEEEFQYLLDDISQIILQVRSESESWMPAKKENPLLNLERIPSISIGPIIVPRSLMLGSIDLHQIAGHSTLEINDPLEDVSSFSDISSTKKKKKFMVSSP